MLQTKAGAKVASHSEESPQGATDSLLHRQDWRMINHVFAAQHLAFAVEVLDASFIFLGMAGAGWLAFWFNHRRQSHAAYELKLMMGLTGYAVLASFFGHYFGPFMPFLIGVEAFGVAPVLSNTFSHASVSFLTAFHSRGSPHPDLSGARHARKVGRIDEAIDMALTELKKDSGHYEGNYLLAEIYWERRETYASFFCLVRILDNPKCTTDQRHRIRQEFDNALSLARQHGWVPPNATEEQIRKSLPTKLRRREN